MRTRILKPEEWGRLDGRDLGALLPFVEPRNIAVIVVEDAGEIMATVAALQATHFEGLWIKPEHRGNPGIFRALIRQAYAVPRVRGERWVFGGAEKSDESMKVLCGRLGGHLLPLEFYAMPVGEGN